MRVNHHREPMVYTVTDAPRPMSEDIGHRQRRYLMSMAVRTGCFVGAILTAVLGAPVWLVILLVVGALFLPYVAVIVANSGREPTASAAFDDPARRAQNPDSGQRPEIGS
ncbi:hypothetical protein GCM10022254_13700 [Actinomadura meridiana]|uniref:DUF3099 domain-containing protein n=1 Tax=Actinomadura meridiana TaxID=559626 RepID=A0ABP8BUX3_9ACTN